MTVAAKTASNGTATSATAPERITGMARVEESRTYHVASTAHDAAFEAERLCNEVYRAASDAYLRDSRQGGTEAMSVLDGPAFRAKIDEAVRCLNTAEEYLRHLVSEPPF